MTASVADEVSASGYAVLPDHRQGADGADVAFSLGKVLQLGDGPPVHRIVPTAKDAAGSNSYSGLYGLGTFPYHTDMAHWRHPPRYMMLRCVVGFDEVPTLLVDGKDVVREVGPEILSRALVQPRRPVRGKMPLLRLYQPNDDVGLIRWDEVFVRPASRAGETGTEKMREALGRAAPVPVALASNGDTVVIDNWRMLHARAPVPERCAGRVIERAYMEHLN